MLKNQKGFAQILLIVGIAAVVAVIGYLVLSRKGISNIPYVGNNQPQTETVAPIQSANDLNNASANLDSTDTTQIDAQLNQLDSASTGF